MNIEQLKKIGGSEWQKGDYHRIYFNNLAEIYGLTCSFYNTGNVSSASLDGEKISNSGARRILSALGDAKLWYDVNSGRFGYKFYGNNWFGKSDMDAIIEKIKNLCEEAQ